MISSPDVDVDVSSPNVDVDVSSPNVGIEVSARECYDNIDKFWRSCGSFHACGFADTRLGEQRACTSNSSPILQSDDANEHAIDSLINEVSAGECFDKIHKFWRNCGSFRACGFADTRLGEQRACTSNSSPILQSDDANEHAIDSLSNAINEASAGECFDKINKFWRSCGSFRACGFADTRLRGQRVCTSTSSLIDDANEHANSSGPVHNESRLFSEQDEGSIWNAEQVAECLSSFSASGEPCIGMYLLTRKHKVMSRHYRLEIPPYNDPVEVELEIRLKTLCTLVPWWCSPVILKLEAAEQLEQDAIIARNSGRFRKAAGLRSKARRLRGQPRVYNFLKRVPRTGWEAFVHKQHGEAIDRDVAFRRYMRMDLAAFESLMHVIGDHRDLQRDATKAKRSDIVVCCPRTIVAVTLMFLGGDSLLSIAEQFGLHRDTIPRLARDGVNALLAYEDHFIDSNPFSSPEKLEALATGFNKRTYNYDKGLRTMQNCVGAVDGIVIRMLKPDVAEVERFRNPKGYYALTFQCMCDADHIITFASKYHYGSTTDSNAFRLSTLGRAVYEKKRLGDKYWIAADNAYACTNEILTPFSRMSRAIKHISFNEKLSSLRCRIEITFGILTNKFRILRYIRTSCVEFAQGIFRTCVLLHNHCRRRNARLGVQSVRRQTEYRVETNSDGTTDIQDFSSIRVIDESTPRNASEAADFSIDTGGGRLCETTPTNSMKTSRRNALATHLGRFYKFDMAKARKRWRKHVDEEMQRREERAAKRRNTSTVIEAQDSTELN